MCRTERERERGGVYNGIKEESVKRGVRTREKERENEGKHKGKGKGRRRAKGRKGGGEEEGVREKASGVLTT